MANASAFRDPRFPPLRKQEYELIDRDIHHVPDRRGSGRAEIVVGRGRAHYKRRSPLGLLLPQVATEYGWDRKTFLEHTCYKAGLPGDAGGRKVKIEKFAARFSEEKALGLGKLPYSVAPEAR